MIDKSILIQIGVMTKMNGSGDSFKITGIFLFHFQTTLLFSNGFTIADSYIGDKEIALIADTLKLREYCDINLSSTTIITCIQNTFNQLKFNALNTIPIRKQNRTRWNEISHRTTRQRQKTMVARSKQ